MKRLFMAVLVLSLVFSVVAAVPPFEAEPASATPAYTYHSALDCGNKKVAFRVDAFRQYGEPGTYMDVDLRITKPRPHPYGVYFKYYSADNLWVNNHTYYQTKWTVYTPYNKHNGARFAIERASFVVTAAYDFCY